MKSEFQANKELLTTVMSGCAIAQAFAAREKAKQVKQFNSLSFAERLALQVQEIQTKEAC